MRFIASTMLLLGMAISFNNICSGSPKKTTQNLNVEISSNLGKKQQSKYRIIITTHPAAFGELQAAKRLSQAASTLGWEWAIVDRLDLQPEYLADIKPNFVMSLREEIKPLPGIPHFLYLHVPMFMYQNKDGTLCTKAYPNVLAYDAFLQVVPNAKPVMNAYVKMHHKPFYSVKTVFSVPKADFIATPKTRLCYWGSIWDKARGSEHYQKFYGLLDKTSYFDLYGPNWSWQKMNLRSYRGMLPIDNHTVLDKISKSGIALVLHSHEHIKGGVPTSRIFEAASASAVIICDQHPFVKEQFGDAVLYIDPNQPAEHVFRQIDRHVKWVQANPDKAVALARKSHSIFLERFTLENELKKIAILYEQMNQSNNLRTSQN